MTTREPMDTVTAEARVVELPLSPPRRLLAPTRWRSFKCIQDHEVWDLAWARVAALVSEGWMVDHVLVDWGRSVPAVGEQRERLLVMIFGALPVQQQATASDRRGRTYVHLRRSYGE